MNPLAGWAKSRFHYAWVAVGVTFLVMLVTAGIRATPSVMMVPLERSFGLMAPGGRRLPAWYAFQAAARRSQ